MIVDARNNLPSTLEANVAIAGACPAGIVLALELAESGHRLLLLEGGGVDSPGEAASIYDNSTSGRGYPLTGSRLRWLGGTSNHWGGWVRPFDEREFSDQPDGELPGWPIDAATLQSWYERAARRCEVGSTDFDPASIRLEQQARLLDLSDTGFRHRIFRFSPPARFGKRYREVLENNDNSDCRTSLPSRQPVR